jgi:hypothetical protein
MWQVTIGYASSPAGRHFDPGHPLTEPIKYRFQWANTTEGCDRTNTGAIIQNAAGQSFSSLTPTDILNGWLIATRNEPFYDVARAVSYSNAVNNTALTIGPLGAWNLDSGQACCRRITCESDITTDAPYAVIQYAIELRGGFKKDADGNWDGFKTRIENDGTTGFYAGGGFGPLVEVINGSIQNVSFPLRLDDKGFPLKAATSLSGPGYFVGTKALPGFALPVNNPSPPTGLIYENAGDAYFVKCFPQTITLKDLNALGL